MSDTNSVLSNIQTIIIGLTSFATVYLGILAYRKNNQIEQLKEEKEYLRKRIRKITSKADPESNRQLIKKAEKNIQILGINSLGLFHHCREEIIHFLKEKKGRLDIILLDPESEIFKHRARKEGDNSFRLVSEWSASLSILRDIEHQSGRIVYLRLRGQSLDRSLLIVDASKKLDDKSKMLINYYPDEPNCRGYAGVQFLSEFVTERDRDSFFKNKEYFSEAWGNATPINVSDYSWDIRKMR